MGRPDDLCPACLYKRCEFQGMAMSAYIIARMDIHSDQWVEEYFARVPHIIVAHGGLFVARSRDVERLEGDGPPPDGSFILKFPSRDHARKFWNSAEFAELRKLRQGGATVAAVLVDGIEGMV